MPYVLMVVGLIFSVLSIFSFALGWEMWRDNIKKGSLVGIVEQSDKRVTLSAIPKLKLSELDGRMIQEIEARDDGRFIFPKIQPGQYLLDLNAPFLHCPTKTINIFPSRDSDIGNIQCGLRENDNWNHILNHSQLTSALYAKNGIVWATGFRTSKNYRNTYVLFQKKSDEDKFSDVVIPEISEAERGAFLYQFSTGEIILGTHGKGAVLSSDNGLSWIRVNLDPDVSSVSIADELPDGAWVLVGNRLLVRSGTYPEGKAKNTIYVSKDKGSSWTKICDLENSVVSFISHSSGRLIVGTQALDGSAGIFYSEDGGSKWLASAVKDMKNLRGIGSIIELSDGTLLAGTQDGKKWKSTHVENGEFLKGGRILKSEDGGKSWEQLAGDENWGDINAIIQLSDKEIMANEGGNFIWSSNFGKNWFVFGKISTSWINDLIDQEDRIVAVSNSGLSEIMKNDIILNHIKQPTE